MRIALEILVGCACFVLGAWFGARAMGQHAARVMEDLRRQLQGGARKPADYFRDRGRKP